MKHAMITRGKRLVLALCALCSLHAVVHAEDSGRYLVMFPSAGLTAGESLRLTLFKPDGTPVRARAQVHDSGGILVALGDGSVRAGEFHTFEFKRADIPLPGEGNTGRLQLRASFLLNTPGLPMGKLAVSMETVSVADGTSNTFMIGEDRVRPLTHGAGDDILIAGRTSHLVPGIARGQTLRVTLINPPAPDEDRGRSAADDAAHGHVRIFDAGGNMIAQSSELAIPPGEFRFFDFNRDALSVPGEPVTGRQQWRMEVAFESKSKQRAPVLAAAEITDNSTASTQLLSGDECLVFFLGGSPKR